MKNIVIPLLAAVSIVSTGAVAWLLATPASLDPRVVKLESELQEARQTISRLKADLARKPAAPVITAGSQSSVAGSTADTPAIPVDKQNLREMFSSPSMRAVIEQQQVAQIEVGYAQLFEHLQLTPEEKAHFKKLLTGRQKIQTDLGLQLMDPNLSKEQRKEILAEAKHQKSVYDASIRGFLNDQNDWQSFQQWENTQPERTQYDTMGRSLFSASAEPLSQSQEQQLIGLMSEVRKSPYSVGALSDQTGSDPTQLTDAVIEQQMQQIDSNNRIIAERAESFLTPGQRATLNTYLEQTKTMSRSGIEMSKMIIRGASK